MITYHEVCDTLHALVTHTFKTRHIHILSTGTGKYAKQLRGQPVTPHNSQFGTKIRWVSSRPTTTLADFRSKYYNKQDAVGRWQTILVWLRRLLSRCCINTSQVSPFDTVSRTCQTLDICPLQPHRTNAANNCSRLLQFSQLRGPSSLFQSFQIFLDTTGCQLLQTAPALCHSNSLSTNPLHSTNKTPPGCWRHAVPHAYSACHTFLVSITPLDML